MIAHFFNLRLDMDVDRTSNSVSEIETKPVSDSSANSAGNAFVMTEAPILSEQASARDLDFFYAEEMEDIQSGSRVTSSPCHFAALARRLWLDVRNRLLEIEPLSIGPNKFALLGVELHVLHHITERVRELGKLLALRRMATQLRAVNTFLTTFLGRTCRVSRDESMSSGRIQQE